MLLANAQSFLIYTCLAVEYPWINTRQSARTRLPLAHLRERGTRGVGAECSVRRKLVKLFCMLQMAPWNEMNLTVSFSAQSGWFHTGILMFALVYISCCVALANHDLARRLPAYYQPPPHMACVTQPLEDFDFQSLISRDFVVVGGAIRRRVMVPAELLPGIMHLLMPIHRFELPSLRSVFTGLFPNHDWAAWLWLVWFDFVNHEWQIVFVLQSRLSTALISPSKRGTRFSSGKSARTSKEQRSFEVSILDKLLL